MTTLTCAVVLVLVSDDFMHDRVVWAAESVRRHSVNVETLTLSRVPTSRAGSLILHHADGTVAGCMLDDDADGCAGPHMRHEGSPVRCFEWLADGCNVCGIHVGVTY